MPYEVKTQYVQISSIIDISIKRWILGQSTPVVKGSMDIGLYLIMVDTAIVIESIDRLIISSGFFQAIKSSYYVIWNEHTAFYLEARIGNITSCDGENWLV